MKAKVQKALNFVGLTDVKNKRASTFSGCMKRRLNLACAIVNNPKLIIIDEPTVGIDPTTGQSGANIISNGNSEILGSVELAAAISVLSAVFHIFQFINVLFFMTDCDIIYV